jgi:16S rRNA (cytosine1402-N4)-methyltransferase
MSMVKDRCGVEKTREISKHIPVLMEEVLLGLNLDQGKSIVDATLGGGGHTRAIWKQIAPTGKLLSLDQDLNAVEHFLSLAHEDKELSHVCESKQLKAIYGNFSIIQEIVEREDWGEVDGIMADLGYSSDQIESSERGLSFMQDGPLDMRLDQGNGVPVSELLTTVSSEELTKIFREYGEVENAKQIAEDILQEHHRNEIQTSKALSELIVRRTPAWLRSKQKTHPATQVFQALRIWVNDEYGHLEKFLEGSEQVLKSGGRIAIISFHSGEDRIIKEFYKAKIKGCICPKEFPICICGVKSTFKVINKKVIVPSDDELQRNPRSRSAKLRIYEKL